MILIVDLCEEPLHRYEFVKPIYDIVARAGAAYEVRTLTDEWALERYEKAIVCGTALKDLAYLEQTNRFAQLAERDIPVLWVCAGMQLLGTLFGGKSQ